ncbi:MAG: cytotoxic translational repressor of toxin-antitoxin stability system [Candidatus Beckwithbacteria bacterium]|nr:cytotoxic translational repressor of toxin-antitoxin stability system [Patescibacteria group bacterium]
MYQVFALHKADKKIYKLHSDDKKKVFKLFTKLRINPLSENLNIKKIKNSKKTFRIRIGKIRITYTIIAQKKQVIITDIGYRGSMYRLF